MAECLVCGKSSNLISKALNVCLECIRLESSKASLYIEKAHSESRKLFGLPPKPPSDPNGIRCNLCVNECRIPEGGISYCGLRTNINGKLFGISQDEGKFSWYYDPLPTNCVADWICAGGCGTGYPEFAYSKGPEYGYKNLAVFFQSCSIDCLFCQNWHFREETLTSPKRYIQELVDVVNKKTSCICYFGGDPTPQLPFALKASHFALKQKKNRILRICWETNGTMNRDLLNEMIEISLKSGGCIKFDLKSWNEILNIALTGVTNKRTIENFSIIAKRIRERPEPPLLVASTLLVPGYIDEEEIRNISTFIASHDKNIPYSLLGFYPHFYMSDLPLTSKDFAFRCKEIAEDAGLKRVKVGNIHLLR
ncbi:MAG: radical SAM protein [Nitrospirae bacterium]|nr:radical SAM protein [Nitrospirota bacterium]